MYIIIGTVNRYSDMPGVSIRGQAEFANFARLERENQAALSYGDS